MFNWFTIRLLPWSKHKKIKLYVLIFMSHFFNVLHLELALHLDSVTDSQTLLTLLAYFLYIPRYMGKEAHTLLCWYLYHHLHNTILYARSKKRLSFLFAPNWVCVEEHYSGSVFWGKWGSRNRKNAVSKSFPPVVHSCGLQKLILL